MDQWRYRRQVVWDRKSHMYYGTICDILSGREVYRTNRHQSRERVNEEIDGMIPVLTESGVL